jgi:hypothetical protein
MSETHPLWHLRPLPSTVLDTICYLSHTHQEPTLTAIAAELRCTKSTALHLLTALAADGKVRIEAGKPHLYRLKGIEC